MPPRNNITENERELVLRMGRNIKRLRGEFQLTQEELAKLSGCSGSYIGQLEAGGGS